MNHLQPFQAREVIKLPTAEKERWRLKRYAIVAENRKFDKEIALAAMDAAIVRLPQAGNLGDPCGNHGVGFQLVHFADIAVVSPVFYWIWGTVLANTQQMRAQWETPTNFENGVNEVVGCIWELEIITFEVQSWTTIMLSDSGSPEQRLQHYLEQHFPIKQTT